jgi:hypothetical protein
MNKKNRHMTQSLWWHKGKFSIVDLCDFHSTKAGCDMIPFILYTYSQPIGGIVWIHNKEFPLKFYEIQVDKKRHSLERQTSKVINQ